MRTQIPETSQQANTSRITTPALNSLAARIVPSFTDLIFVVLACYAVFLSRSSLLVDAGLGWHIRNGENMIRTLSFTRVDTFSYTMAGKPWFAWEWLFDVGSAAVNHFSGLLGICVATGIVFATCFASLYHLLLARTRSADFSEDPIVAIALAVLAALISNLHLLARPHIFSWLFAVITLAVLHKAKKEANYLYILPALTIVWTNVHGSFPLVLVFVAIFFVGGFFEDAPGALRPHGRPNLMRALAASFTGCLFATFINPYGYLLHVHIVKYLSTPFFMNNISEFQSPNFHQFTERLFILLVAMLIIALAYRQRRVPATDLLLILFAVATGLLSARNIPVSAILLAYVTAPLLSSALQNRQGSTWPARCCRALQDMSANASEVQRNLRGHLPAMTAAVVLVVISLTYGLRDLGTPFATTFPKNFPAAATEKISDLQITKGVFTSDQWGSYLIYNLYPTFKVFTDDRHDFYGPEFVENVADARSLKNWKSTFDRYDVRWALVPPDSPLAEIMNVSSEWKLEYKDSVAALYHRN